LNLEEGVDFAIFIFGAHEPVTVASYLKLVNPGDTVLDIGANIGSHTLPLAKLVGLTGTVVAIEPTVYAIEKLRKNLSLNTALGSIVRPVHAMLGEATGTPIPDTLPSSWPLNQKGDIHPLMGSQEKSTKGARMMSVDDLFKETSLKTVNLIKLDVDGFEVAILRGARNTLAEHRPRIVLELAEYTLRERGYSLQEILVILSDLDYVLYDDHLSKKIPIYHDNYHKYLGSGESINIIALNKKDPLSL